MREITIQKIEDSYAEMFRGYEVPAPIRRCACLVMFRFGISGLCDGMYISNTIAVISELGDGQGHFLECKRTPEKLAECADEIAEQIQCAYCSCIPEDSKAELAGMIKSQNLNDTETVHGMEELVTNYKAEIKFCEEWRLWYLDAKVKQLEKNIALIKSDAVDTSLRSELSARFDHAMEEGMDELDFFTDLLDAGFRLDDIRKYLPERYEYSRTFMEEHGLI